MNSDHVIALALIIAELRMQVSQLSAENEQLRAQQPQPTEEPAK